MFSHMRYTVTSHDFRGAIWQHQRLLRCSANHMASGWPFAGLAQAGTRTTEPAGSRSLDAGHDSRAAHINDGYLIVT